MGCFDHLQKPSELPRRECDQMCSQTVPHLYRSERAISHEKDNGRKLVTGVGSHKARPAQYLFENQHRLDPTPHWTLLHTQATTTQKSSAPKPAPVRHRTVSLKKMAMDDSDTKTHRTARVAGLWSSLI